MAWAGGTLFSLNNGVGPNAPTDQKGGGREGLQSPRALDAAGSVSSLNPSRHLAACRCGPRATHLALRAGPHAFVCLSHLIWLSPTHSAAPLRPAARSHGIRMHVRKHGDDDDLSPAAHLDQRTLGNTSTRPTSGEKGAQTHTHITDSIVSLSLPPDTPVSLSRSRSRDTLQTPTHNNKTNEGRKTIATVLWRGREDLSHHPSTLTTSPPASLKKRSATPRSFDEGGWPAQ